MMQSREHAGALADAFDSGIGGFAGKHHDLVADVAHDSAASPARNASPDALPSLPAAVLIQHALDVALLVDPAGRVGWAAPSIERVLGYREQDVIGNSIYTMCHPEDATRVMTLLSHVLNASDAGHTAGGDLRLQHGDGSWREMDVRAINLLDTPDVAGILLVAHDVTRHKRSTQSVQRQALFDPLTGLPNRTLFLTWLDHALARAARAGDPVVVMFMDLDDLELTNVRYGRATGDRLLAAFGQRLRASLRATDTAARLGSDEFIVLFEGIGDNDEAALVATRIIEEFRAPFLIGDQPLRLTVSIGVAFSRSAAGPGSSHEFGAGDLLRQADIALSKAKAAGKNRWLIEC